jgi:hypothetical protein
MSRAIRRAVLRDCGGNHPRVHSARSCAKGPDNWCRAPLQSPLRAIVGELENLRLARPLSWNEEIALRQLDQFNECELCPEMLVGPAGQFLIGAKDGEDGSALFWVHG